jgi:hypothetical protein
MSATRWKCEAHKHHDPVNRTIEFHHVIPVAWQLHTTVSTPPFPGQDPDGRGMLWDNRGVWLCPTGHRNVHYWIVLLMHRIATSQDEDPQAALRAVVSRPAPSETPIALEALTRFVEESGGSLINLTSAGQWGQS